jgi:2-iminobutanoate/2-iminopropanoate deaminase
MSCKEKQIVVTNAGPKAIGPYSVGVLAGPFIFVSGQIGLSPASGVMVEGGVEAETRQALNNLKLILESGNSSLEKVVKTTVFLNNMTDFGKVNEIYAEYFKENPPARSAVQVAALPKNAQVEIEAIALTNKDE